MRALALLLAGALACSGNTPVSVADRFVGRYYVEIDHTAALALATDAAAVRVQREMALLADARRGGAVAPGDRPRVYFERMGDPDPRGDGFRITYKLTVRVHAGAPLERHVVVDLRKVGDAWRVASFTEAG